MLAHGRKHAESYNGHGPSFKIVGAVKSSFNPVHAALCSWGWDTAQRELLQHIIRERIYHWTWWGGVGEIQIWIIIALGKPEQNAIRS